MANKYNTPHAMTKARKNFSSIQGVRAIAAGAVAFFHIFSTQNRAYPDYALLANFEGAWGVDLFFVISGFVMMYISRDVSPGIDTAKSFMYRRLIRIVPLYWIYTFISLALVFLLDLGIPTFSKILHSLFFIPDGFPVLMIGWTLNFEIYFYLVFAVSLLFGKKYRLPVLTLWFFGTCLAGFMTAPFEMYWEFSGWLFYTNPIVLEFLAGVYLGYLYFTEKYFSPKLSYIFLLVAFPCYFLAAAYDTEHHSLRFLLWGIPSVFILYSVLSLEAHGKRTPPILQQLGDSSYSLYLSHITTIIMFSSVWNALELQGHVGNLSYLLITVGAVYVISSFSYRYIELPSYRYLQGI